MTFEEEPPPSSDTLDAGTPVGPYAIVRKLGWGGMATVYEARDEGRGGRIAIKVLHRRYAAHPVILERFLHEARAASRLAHPHVVRVIDVGTDGAFSFIVMDLLDGDDLATVLEKGGKLDTTKIADILLPVCSAVASAHEAGILHRDLKPANIMLTDQRSGAVRPVLVDFGIAKTLESRPVSLHTAPGQVLGTPYYMSPEQINSASTIDARSDQYALGVILYECVTGRLPFPEQASLFLLMASIVRGDAPSASRFCPGLPRAFERVIERAMRADRDERFASVTELGRALFPFASHAVQLAWAAELGPREGVSSGVASLRPAPKSRPAIGVGPAELRAFPAFEEQNDVELDMFLLLAPPRFFAAGATLFSQGDAAESCFLMLSGEVDVVKSVGARSQVQATLQAGTVVGQMALIDREPRTASVIARVDTVAAEVGSDLFFRLLRAHTPIAMRFREQIAVAGIRQLRRATARMAELSIDGADAARASRPRSLSAELLQVQAAASEWDIAIEMDEPPKL